MLTRLFTDFITEDVFTLSHMQVKPIFPLSDVYRIHTCGVLHE